MQKYQTFNYQVILMVVHHSLQKAHAIATTNLCAYEEESGYNVEVAVYG